MRQSCCGAYSTYVIPPGALLFPTLSLFLLLPPFSFQLATAKSGNAKSVLLLAFMHDASSNLFFFIIVQKKKKEAVALLRAVSPRILPTYLPTTQLPAAPPLALREPLRAAAFAQASPLCLTVLSLVRQAS